MKKIVFEDTIVGTEVHVRSDYVALLAMHIEKVFGIVCERHADSLLVPSNPRLEPGDMSKIKLCAEEFINSTDSGHGVVVYKGQWNAIIVKL